MNRDLEPRACRMLFWALFVVFQICGGSLWGFSGGAREASGASAPHSWVGDSVSASECAGAGGGRCQLGASGAAGTTWKVPGLNGIYGGVQGGVEAVVDDAGGGSGGLVSDVFGNVRPASRSAMDGLSRVGSYGLLPGALPDYSEEGQGLAAATFWRGRRSDLTGLVYMGARYYDPGTGRFLSPDPLGHDASLSLYDYAGGDPVNQLDPDGRCVKGLFGGAVKGDYYKPENTAQAVGQFLGQVGVGFTPAGILADIRDLSAAYRDIQNDGLSWGSGTNLALGAVAVIPGVGDVVKGAGKVILRTFTKNAQEIRAIDRAAVLSDAPKVHLSELGNAAENGLERVTGSFDAFNPGSLSDDLAGTFSGGRYREVILDADTLLHRAGTAGKPYGQFFDLTPPQGILQTRIDKAVLPRWPSGATSQIDSAFGLRIPKGTKVYVGEVGSQGGIYVGGTQQVVVPTPWKIPGVVVESATPLR